MSLQRIALALAVIAANFAASSPAQEEPNDYFYVDDSGQSLDQSSGNEGCGDLGCEDCCCGPHWKFQAGMRFLRRDRSSWKPIVNLSEFGVLSTPALDGSDLYPEWTAGWELAAQRELACDYAVEFRYFQVDDMRQQFEFDPTQGSGASTNTGANGVFNSNLVSATLFYDSDLWNLEANLKKNLGRYRLLVGFRYFDLDEKIRLNGIDTSFNNIYYTTDNDLYGVQLGIEGALNPVYWELRVDWTAKAGVYLNDVSLRNGRTISFSPTTASNHLAMNNTAFVGELDVIASYPLTCNWSVRGGLELLWIDGVALAADQISNNPRPALPLEDLDSTGSPFYTGLTLGLEYLH